MNTSWYKVRGDFRAHRVQVCFIGLVLLLGAAGVMATLNARATLRREIDRSFAAAQSADVSFGLEAVTPALLALVREHPAVAAAEARRVLGSRAAGPLGEWYSLRLTIVADFADQRVGVVHRHGGGWERADEGLYVEQSSLGLLGPGPVETLRVRGSGGQTFSIPVAGLVHDTAIAPGFQERMVYAYATPAVAARLGQDGPLDQIFVRLRNRPEATRVIGELREQLVAAGASIRRAEILPRSHPHAMLMAAMLRVLGFLAALAFLGSAALSGYVVSLWMKREVRQVGIMKAIGATSAQLAWQYLALVAPLVLISTALALPLGGWLGEFLIRYNEVNLNIDVVDRGTPWTVLAGQAVLAALLPFLVMAFPISRAARQAAREAMQDAGITAQSVAKPGWRTRVLLPGNRQWTFALRNLFRRPWRLAITLLALTTGGALLLVANFVFASLMAVVDASLARQGYDLQVSLRRPIALAELGRLAGSVEAIETAEIWQRGSVQFGRGDKGLESHPPERGLLVSYPGDSALQRLPAAVGRWPRADESDAVAIGRPAREALGTRVGETVVLEVANRPRRIVRIVGEFEEFAGPAFYLPLAGWEGLAGPVERSALLVVKAKPARLTAAADALDLAFIDARIDVASIETRATRRAGMEEHFLGVVGICNLVAFAAALFGAVSLIAFGCLNVLERAREIGVIRTLGATPARVSLLFVAESAVVVALSFLLAGGAALGLTCYLNHLIETLAFKLAIPLQVSPAAVGLLLGGVIVVLLGVWATVSSLVKSTVREALAYE